MRTNVNGRAQLQDVERVRAVPAARPDVWLGADARFHASGSRETNAMCMANKVQLIGRPFAFGQGDAREPKITDSGSTPTCTPLRQIRVAHPHQKNIGP